MKTLKFLFCFIGFFLFAATYWTTLHFGHVSIDQILSTMTFGDDAVFGADKTFIFSFIFFAILLPLVASLAVTLIKSLRRFYLIPFFVFIMGISTAIFKFHVIDFIETSRSHQEDFFAKNYVAPVVSPSKKELQKSLVLIYVESLENTYQKSDIFNRDLLQSLDHMPRSFSFDNFVQMQGANWTIAGFISSQCGIPFKDITIFDGNTIGQDTKKMMPGAVCFSDILAKYHYKNIFMKGGELSFAGFDHFLKTHHFDEQYGKDEWIKKGISESQMGPWGLHDDDLFAAAKIRLKALIRSKEKFNLTLLTVDMHGITGYPSQYCIKKGYSDFPGYVECDSQEISSFVHYIIQQGWLDRLNIVVMGDHLAMINSAHDKIMKNKNRLVFNELISKETFYKKTNTITHFDLLPTFLTFLGFDVKDQKAGLGYNCIATNKKDASVDVPDNARISEIKENIQYRSARYNQFWH